MSKETIGFQRIAPQRKELLMSGLIVYERLVRYGEQVPVLLVLLICSVVFWLTM